MVTEALQDFLTPEFVDLASHELKTCGFISDEHPFAPYRETVSQCAPEIEEALHGAGYAVKLRPGFVNNHPGAGYSYFIYDADRFGSPADAEKAVSAWLDTRYSQGE